MPAFFEFRAHCQVIVDFAVEDDPAVAIFGEDGLIAVVEIDDFEARGAQRKKARGENALVIRSTVDERCGSFSNAFGWRTPIFSGEAGNSAQCWALLRLARFSAAMSQ